MSALDHRGNRLPSQATPTGRALARDLKAIRHEVVVGLAEAAGMADFAAQAMTATTALDRHRQLLAQGDDFLNNLLAQEEVGFVLEVMNIQSRMYRQY